MKPPGSGLGRVAAWIVAIGTLGIPAIVLADDADGSPATGGAVVILLVVGAAYLLTHFVVEGLQRRFLVVSGLEYVVLGVILGPVVPEIRAFEADMIAALLPIIALAAGWVGLMRGMEVDLSRLKDAPLGAFRLGFADDVFAALFVGLGAVAAFESGWFGEASWQEMGMSVGVLACCAAAGSTASIDILKRRYHIEGRTVPLLRRSARMGDAVALFVFGLLFCIFREPAPDAPLALLLDRPVTPAEWIAVAIGLGMALGLLFRPFLGGDESENGRFLALVGIITFASGAAYFLDLSPLLVNLVLGIVLANMAKSSGQLHGTLERTERPMSLVLLLFAGALWTPPAAIRSAFESLSVNWDWGLFTVGNWEALVWLLGSIAWWILLPLAGFTILRLLGKAAGNRMAALGTPLRTDLYKGLVGHGDVTIAMAISFQLVTHHAWHAEGDVVNVAYSVILASVVFHDFFAPRILRSLLVDAGELRREQEA